MSYRKMDKHGSPQYCRHFLADNSIFHVERCMSVMQSGTQMVKLKNGSKGLVRLFYLDEHRSCIRWRPSRKSEKAKITIDSLYKVTEGRQSDIFHRHAEGNFDPSCCFTIYHGNHMESLDLVTSNAEEARTWVTGLRYLMAGISDEDSLAKRQRTHDQWMKQTFEEADKNGDGLLNIEEIYQLLHKLNVNLPRRKVKQMFQEADTDDQQGTLTFEEFTVFYKMMSLRRDLYLLLMCFSEKKDHLTGEELGNFLRVEQKESDIGHVCACLLASKSSSLISPSGIWSPPPMSSLLMLECDSNPEISKATGTNWLTDLKVSKIKRLPRLRLARCKNKDKRERRHYAYMRTLSFEITLHHDTSRLLISPSEDRREGSVKSLPSKPGPIFKCPLRYFMPVDFEKPQRRIENVKSSR
ncbi:1-phosphatidylinositol 4,5-bisphosphate phosphodiesterase eta-1 [Puntigrus tetrazona]|uniref:1-phosphatidylinositol 4,5-bisphosphate phosphodiesterase eta-1 n=1 Tax=Puntigrus tetrazona TaxID=1606681 RepID=UPI001C8A9C97|nr:1-phosphatidylinositol 4,5-bisphosphate phosphodiesterase eta-1 [Puntigrus tetrazona]